MSVPDILKNFIEQSTDIKITGSQPLYGGSINQSAKLQTDQGHLFMKWNSNVPGDMFDKEVKGLELLRNAGTGILIPDVVICHSDSTRIPAFLLLDYIEPQKGSGRASEIFGRQLSKLHGITNAGFGLHHDNYIGRLPQSNHRHSHWLDFFIHERIEPQLKLAVDHHILEPPVLKHWDRLSQILDSIFPETHPRLLHGDLWSGNYFYSNDQPVLIDPSVYFGHHEMELSFTTLFGGFPPDFYDAYREETPLEHGFKDRTPVYNLYPLLVHANLFGGHYTDQIRTFLEQY